MNLGNKIYAHILCFFVFGLTVVSCQKFERPELTDLILDPPLPALMLLDSKSYWHFDDNARDTGEYKLTTVANNISYGGGVEEGGKAAIIGTDGYVLATNLPEGLKSPGSLTLAFWMKGTGPVQGGAQGLFAIGNSAEFWGNFEMFLENDTTTSQAFLKIHMFNINAPDSKGEEWTELKIPGALNKWTHIAVTYDSSNSQLTIYADGQPTAINKKVLAGGNYGSLKFNNVSGLEIGTWAFETTPSLASHGKEDWAKSFNGSLDQFRIFNRPLSQTEISNLVTNKY